MGLKNLYLIKNYFFKIFLGITILLNKLIERFAS